MNVQYWLAQIEKYSNSTAQPLVILLGNKCDLKEERKVTFEKGQELANDFNIPFFETSAKSAININEAFSNLCKGVIETQKSKCLMQLQTDDDSQYAKSIKLHEKYNDRLDKLKQKIKCSGCSK